MVSTTTIHAGFDSREFGRRVASARAWRGLAPKELAYRLGRSDEAIYRIERGERTTPPDKLLRRALATELGVSEEWLLGRADAPPWTGSGQTDHAAGELLRALATLREDLSARLDELERLVARGPTWLAATDLEEGLAK